VKTNRSREAATGTLFVFHCNICKFELFCLKSDFFVAFLFLARAAPFINPFFSVRAPWLSRGSQRAGQAGQGKELYAQHLTERCFSIGRRLCLLFWQSIYRIDKKV